MFAVLRRRVVRAVVVMGVSVGLVAGVPACSVSGIGEVTTDPVAAADSLDVLNGASKVTVSKKMMTIGDQWDVSAGGEKFHIEGKKFKAFGQSYVLTDDDGVVLGGEQEEFLHFPRAARVFGPDGEQDGEVRQKMLSLTREFSLVRGGDTVASMRQKMVSWSMSAEIKDGSGSVAWKTKDAVMRLSPKLTVERVGGKSSVSAVDAVLMSVILSKVHEAEKDK